MKEFLFIVLSVCLLEIYAEKTVVTKTKVGTIIGSIGEVDVFGETKRIARYLGIPYAEPPIGELRFKKPVPIQPFTSQWKAVKHGKACSQTLTVPNMKDLLYGEDCLFLNIYKPNSMESKDHALPVMVFIHGGRFTGGSADSYDSDTLSLYGNVMVVTINYRVSVFGFLSTGDTHSPGNYGLWDQHMALKWIHYNIDAFGGDPNRVTIFGESSGGASVVYQCLYEGNRGLFQRAIAQSGGLTHSWSFQKKPKPIAEWFGNIVGCKDMESGPLVECLRNQPEETLSAVLNDPARHSNIMAFPFIPSVDGDFVKEPIDDMINGDAILSSDAKQFFSSLDFMTGINADEGSIMLRGFLLLDAEIIPDKSYFENVFVPLSLHVAFGSEVPEIVKDIVTAEYTDWSDQQNGQKIRIKMADLTADHMFSAPMLEASDLHNILGDISKDTYMYLFDALPSKRLYPIVPSWSKNASHADELIYLFYGEQGGHASLLHGEEYGKREWERAFAKQLITLWTNFAKTG